MSRVLEALKQFEISTPEVVSTGSRMTPRLSASVRKAVLGKSTAVILEDSSPVLLVETPVLFRVPKSASVPAAEVAAPNVEPANKTPPVVVSPVQISDEPVLEIRQASSMALVDAIAESIRAVEEDDASDKTKQPQVFAPITAAERRLALELADSARSQPYRMLLQAVLRDTKGMCNPLVGIVSIEDDDLTANAIASLASLYSEETASRVLMIDANGSGKLSLFYDVADRPGLIELIQAKNSVSDVTIKTSNPRVDLIARGRSDDLLPLPSTFSNLLKGCEGDYGAIFIEAGSMTNTWAVSACRAADTTYVAVHFARTSAEIAVSSVKRLRAAGIRLAGSIVIGE